MRLNRYIALATGHSRRSADKLIVEGKVSVNGNQANLGTTLKPEDVITIAGKPIVAGTTKTTIVLNKPVGYVCSRNGQGSKTVYDLLPEEFHKLKPVGRLDKDSSGLLLLTDDGELANKLTHPRYSKQKIYKITLDRNLPERDRQNIQKGVTLEDGQSRLNLAGHGKNWHVTMQEGRNRQIRRTFEALGYKVITLHRIQFGDYHLDNLAPGKIKNIHQSQPNTF
jgi:23S rRNA pseudouridine2605 synthase